MKTNVQLYQDIMDKLAFEPAVVATDIAVKVENGVVTLGGKVSSLWEKHAAEQAVLHVSGVMAVANELQVDLNGHWRQSDADIANAAVSALKWNWAVPGDRIQVSVENGRVTLTGSVNWQFQREAAEKAIRRLRGIKSLNNQITLQADILPKDVKSRINREFHRHAQLDADHILVEVDGSKVTLKGHVRSWAELQEARRAAWAVPGVTDVNNQLVISYI